MDSRGLFVGFALVLGVVAAADDAAETDPQVEFTVAYNAYREAMEASRYSAAVLHAEQARELGALASSKPRQSRRPGNFAMRQSSSTGTR